jgi:hypothetical protein
MKYEVYIKGKYVGAINKTLRVMEVPSGEECCKCALQYFIDQHPQNITIIPAGEHKKSKALTLSDIAPTKVRKPRMNTIAKGSHFSNFTSH